MQKKKKWDDELSVSLHEDWHVILNDAKIISNINIDRFVGNKEKTGYKAQIHCFCDALQLAYSACVYLKHADDKNKTVKCNLIFAKSHMAPLNKKLTISRLELNAVVLGTQCLKFAEKYYQ